MSGCGTFSPGFLSAGSQAKADKIAAKQRDDRRVVAPDIGAAGTPCRDPGVNPNPEIATIENRAYAQCSDDKRASAVAGVARWQREFGR